MRVSKAQLEQTLLTNVVDLRFSRRRPKEGVSPIRRMLCTKSSELLNSTNGRLLLNYYAPTQQPNIIQVVSN
jgi:hypothetical protein